jgi:hypothetical protein
MKAKNLRPIDAMRPGGRGGGVELPTGGAWFGVAGVETLNGEIAGLDTGLSGLG